MRFQQVFLENIRRNGRLCEVPLMGCFKTQTFLGDGNLPRLVARQPARAPVDEARQATASAASGSAIAAWCGEFSRSAGGRRTILHRRERNAPWNSATIPVVPCTGRRTTTGVGARLPGGPGRGAARTGRLDLLRGNAAHSLNRRLALALPARNLALAERDGLSEFAGALPDVLDGVDQGPRRIGGLGPTAAEDLGDRRARRWPARRRCST